MEVRTRALAMAEEREEEAKRMKFDSSSSSSSLNHQQQQQQHKNHRRPLVIIKSENIPDTPEENSTTRVTSSDRCSSIITTSWREQLTSSSLSSSRCSSNESYEIVMMRSTDIDLEASEGFQLENSTTYFVAGDKARREVMTQSSNLISDESNQMPSSSSSLETNSLRNSSKMPSEAEIESFFSEIEKDEQKRLTERYNYDFVKDVPLEGRFVWVPVKP